MFHVQDPLGLYQFLVKLMQRQCCRQDDVLDVKEAVIASLNFSGFGLPALGAGVRGIDTDIHHLGNLQAPLADYFEALTVPSRIGNEVDRDRNAERSCELQRFKILTESDALAM